MELSSADAVRNDFAACHSVSPSEELSPLKHPWLGLIQGYIDGWQSDLRAAFAAAGLASDVDVMPCGSIACGHCRGPKPCSHASDRSGIPQEFSSILEGDVRVILPASTHPHDPKVIAIIEQATGWTIKEYDTIRRWEETLPVCRGFFYEDLHHGIGFQWEMSIVRKPYLEISEFWDRLFTAKEIEWQGDLRDIVRLAEMERCHPEQLPTDFDFVNEVGTIKDIQCNYGRYRLLASYALDHVLATNGEGHLTPKEMAQLRSYLPNALPPLRGEPPPIIEPVLELWLSGHKGISLLERPSFFMTPQFQRYLENEMPDLAKTPPIPEWLERAYQLQRLLRGERSALGDRRGDESIRAAS